MQVVEVKTKRESKAFLRVPRFIYQKDPNWIPHLDRDIEAVFNAQTNPSFQDGEVCRWILKDSSGQLLGRVDAFINNNLAHTHKQPTGRMGFFECINDKKAAFLLFDTCKEWLSHRGMEAMDGPVNFGEKERFWGLLIDGFGMPPPYLMNYHPPYYRKFFEEYGFHIYYEQYVYRIEADTHLPPILGKKYERLTKNQGYRFEHMQLRFIEQYAEDFMTIYNNAWSRSHKNFRPMSKEQAIKNFTDMKDVVDEELIVFGYHHGKPIAFFIGIPELNQIFRYLNGNLNLWNKLKFVYYRWRGECRTIYGLVFGIVPEYQNRGIESALVMSVKQFVSRRNFYKSMMITWIGDFNPKMIKIIEHIGAKKMFTLATYRKMFDKEAVFERHPVID